MASSFVDSIFANGIEAHVIVVGKTLIVQIGDPSKYFHPVVKLVTQNPRPGEREAWQRLAAELAALGVKEKV